MLIGEDWMTDEKINEALTNQQQFLKRCRDFWECVLMQIPKTEKIQDLF